MRELARQAWPEVLDQPSLLVVPLGATEQHGPHLPLGTDTEIAEALARELAKRIPSVTVAPAVPYGASGEHQEFAGTISIGHTALEMLLVELGRSASATFPRMLFLSGHGGNAKPLARAVRRLRSEGRDARAWSAAECWRGDAHAGRVETSVMLALSPADVNMAMAAEGDTRPLAEILPQLQAGGVAAVSRNGVLGDPSAANEVEGINLLTTAVDELAAALSVWPDHDGAWL
jgi:mycofactocin system creatininase family protein